MALQCHRSAIKNAFLSASVLCVLAYATLGMQEHIKPLRLFDLSQTGAGRKLFELEQWEKDHLRECEECQRVLDVFARQFGKGSRKRENDAQ